jgi:cysteinyl-tRNA synthetase
MHGLAGRTTSVEALAIWNAHGVHAASDGERRRTARLQALHRCARWAPVIGADVLGDLDGHDLVVVDGLADADGDDRLARRRLSAVPHGALAISYLSLGTIEKWRSYAGEVPNAWTLGRVHGWPGERYVDARRSGWQEIMLREAVKIAERGFDGLFLDNLDVSDDHPRTRTGVVELVQRLRASVGDLLLVAQNGLGTVEHLPVDAISHEDVWWRWEGHGYAPSHPSDTTAILTGLRRQRERGLTVLTLDYTEPGAAAADEVVARSRAEGFLPAVSVLALDRAPHAPLAGDARPARTADGGWR